jgi:Fe-S-cluster containining protein
MSDSRFSCQACGACCFGLDVVLDPDEARFFESRTALALLVERRVSSSGHETYLMKRDRHDKCIGLAGSPGCYACRIYDDRPVLCREMAPGSAPCLAARRAAGFDDGPDEGKGDPDAGEAPAPFAGDGI